MFIVRVEQSLTRQGESLPCSDCYNDETFTVPAFAEFTTEGVTLGVCRRHLMQRVMTRLGFFDRRDGDV